MRDAISLDLAQRFFDSFLREGGTCDAVQAVVDDPAKMRRLLEAFPPQTRFIRDLRLSVRARKSLIRRGVQTVDQLVQLTGDDILSCPNVGLVTLNEIRELLSTFRLKLQGD